MTISFSMPDRVEQYLRTALGGDVSQAAKEALAVDLYRKGNISLGLLAEMLGMGVLEADAWLADRGVPLNYSAQDFEADQKALAEVFPGVRE
jgi:predicted HTH domain antitoxin